MRLLLKTIFIILMNKQLQIHSSGVSTHKLALKRVQNKLILRNFDFFTTNKVFKQLFTHNNSNIEHLKQQRQNSNYT